MQNISAFQQRRPPHNIHHPLLTAARTREPFTSCCLPHTSAQSLSPSLSHSGKTPEGMDERERVRRGARHAQVGEGVCGPSEHFWQRKPVVIH